MKLEDLKTVIRQIIKEEVKKEVQTHLPKLLFKLLGQTKPLATTPGKPRLPTRVAQTPPTPIVESHAPKPLKHYAKDPILNKILNEVTPPKPTDTMGVDLAKLGFGKIGQVPMDAFNTEQLLTESDGYSPPVEIVPALTAPSALPNLFNKDFRAILNKSKELSLNGGINRTLQ